MSASERERAGVVRSVVVGQLLQREGAERLGICVWQMKQPVRAFRADGDRALVLLQRWLTSTLRVKAEVKTRFLGLLRDKYQRFGPTLTAESWPSATVSRCRARRSGGCKWSKSCGARSGPW